MLKGIITLTPLCSKTLEQIGPENEYECSKRELDDSIRELKSRGEKFSGIFYLNGNVDIILHSVGIDNSVGIKFEVLNNK